MPILSESIENIPSSRRGSTKALAGILLLSLLGLALLYKPANQPQVVAKAVSQLPVTAEPVIPPVPEEIPYDTPLSKITAPKTLPEMAKLPMIQASLAALKENGADLTKPMPSRHQIICETAEIAAQVSQWGSQHGFTAAAPTKYNSHGEVEQFMVFLVKTAPPVAEEIQRQGQDVFAGMAPISGALYFSWMGAMVR